MTRAEVWAKNWAKNWAKFSAHFRASFTVQNDPQIFSQNSSQFITPCLVAGNMKFHLRELLGFGDFLQLRFFVALKLSVRLPLEGSVLLPRGMFPAVLTLVSKCVTPSSPWSATGFRRRSKAPATPIAGGSATPPSQEPITLRIF